MYQKENVKPLAGDSNKKTDFEGLKKLASIDQEKPVDQQPQAGSSSKKAESEGLKKLAKTSAVMIKLTKKDKTKNLCKIKDSLGNNLFNAEEEGFDCCYGTERPFDMELKDGINKVIHLKRPMKCQTFCFPGCFQYLEVSLPDGTIVGTAKQEWSMRYSFKFNICDQKGNVVMKITSYSFAHCGDVGFFKLTLPDGKEIGIITTRWDELDETDNSDISFSVDLDVHSKATIIGAVMFICFMTNNIGCLDIVLCNTFCCSPLAY